jgi:hypothetical protein
MKPYRKSAPTRTAFSFLAAHPKANSLFVCLCAAVGLTLPVHAEGTGLSEIKSYLLGKVGVMDKAAHDFAMHAAAYEKLISASGGDYNKAVQNSGDELLALIATMQDDYRTIHNTGYESIEGIVAGVRPLVDFDTYLDAGVPKAEASTDSPASPLVLKTAAGKTIVDRNGNLFHYVMEPALWGTKAVFVQELSHEAVAKAKGAKVLPKSWIGMRSQWDRFLSKLSGGFQCEFGWLG